jgi:hypothetical protein
MRKIANPPYIVVWCGFCGNSFVVTIEALQVTDGLRCDNCKCIQKHNFILNDSYEVFGVTGKRGSVIPDEWTYRRFK